jgi:hypothetical protein
MDAPITVIETPNLAGKRRALVLAEDHVGHYAEFRAFFSRTFALDAIGLARPGYVRAPSRCVYEFVFIGRSGEPFPSGVEVYASVDALQPLDEEMIDRDLWAILRWMITGVGSPWKLEDLDATGRLYRLPAATALPL